MRFKNRVAALAVIIGFAATSGWAQKTIEEIVARVNADIILKSEYDAAIRQLGQQLAQQGLQGTQLQQTVAQQSKDVLRNLIDEKLIVQVAKDMGLNADLDVIRYMEQLRQQNNLPSLEALEDEMRKQGLNVDEQKQRVRTQVLTNQVLQRDVYHRVSVTTEEMRAYYEANKKNFDRPQGIRLSEIGIFTEKKTPEEAEAQKKKAEEALAALKRGDDFIDAAKKFSESQTAGEGGDLGFFEKGELNSALEQIASKLEKGQFSEIIPLTSGFMILKVTDKHEGGVLPFELAQDEINNILWNQRIQPKIREYLTKLRQDGFIDVREGYVDSGAPPKTPEVKPVKN